MAVYDALKNKLIRVLRREVTDVVVGATGLTPSEAVEVAKVATTLAKGAQTPSPKSISGATDIFLKKIMADFPNFSNSDAEKALSECIHEYIDIKYEGKTQFEMPNVARGVETTSERSREDCKIGNITIHRFAIADYEKSEEYATISYQAACGFDVITGIPENDRHLEKRYKLDYSLRFVQDGESAVSYICPNCNATLGAKVRDDCPYCGAHVVWDTIYSWYIASITED